MLKSTMNGIWRQIKKTVRKVSDFLFHGCEVEDIIVLAVGLWIF